jgi:hypothetical protein
MQLSDVNVTVTGCEIIPERFKNKAKVASVFKGPINTDNVLLVFGVRLLEFIEYLRFFQTGFVPE